MMIMWLSEMSKKRKTVKLIIDFIIIALLVWLDHFTKNLAVEKLKDQSAFILVKNVFELNYLENRGAAFGVFQNQRVMFLVTGIIVLAIVIYVLVRLPQGKKYNWLEVCMVLIASGAIGNMIDRMSQGYVVDFFYFVLIDFPIFNVADVYVTVSCILMAVLVLFIFKDEELSFLSPRKNKENKE